MHPELSGRSLQPAKGEDCPTRCSQCGQHFAAGDRFCPFDGEPLVREADWDPRGDPLLDSVVDGRYRIEAVIGQGGMGTVYRVRHVLLDKLLALKALRADLASDPEIAARFIHEARTAASVSHPDLVQISDFGTLPTGQAYFVMELLSGVPLSALLRHGALAPRRAVRIVRKVATAVQAAHDAGIIHRDLKPDNIHVRVGEGDDEIKIVDFGLARVIGTNRVTRTGVVFGTPYYMSPEQASGESLDARSDLYALGVLFYEMLTGRVPFEGDTYMGVLTQHIYMKPLPLAQRLGKPLAVDELDAVVLRCLEKQPSQRYASMRELVAALDALDPDALSDEPLGIAPPPEQLRFDLDEVHSSRLVFERPSNKRPFLLAAAFGVAVLAAVVVSAFVLPSADAEPPPAPPRAAAAPALAKQPSAPPPAVAAPAPSSEAAPPPAHPAPAASATASRAASHAKSGSRPRRQRLAPKTQFGSEIVDPWGSSH